MLPEAGRRPVYEWTGRHAATARGAAWRQAGAVPDRAPPGSGRPRRHAVCPDAGGRITPRRTGHGSPVSEILSCSDPRSAAGEKRGSAGLSCPGQSGAEDLRRAGARSEREACRTALRAAFAGERTVPRPGIAGNGTNAPNPLPVCNRDLPIAGDRKYSTVPADYPIALWSGYICFQHPGTERTMEFAALPPAEAPWDCFSASLAELRNQIPPQPAPAP